MWRERVSEARLRYQKACTASRAAWEDFRDHGGEDRDAVVRNARELELAATKEYRQVLKAFTGLVLHGKIPEE